jgi:hypothetical protein
MTYLEHSDLPMQNLLAAVTDALLTDDGEIDAIIEQYQLPADQVTGAINLIRRLHLTLVGVHPSRKFARRLRQDLVGVPDRNLINRVRYLPPRVQIAAGVALIAGFMLLSRRRMITDAEAETVHAV